MDQISLDDETPRPTKRLELSCSFSQLKKPSISTSISILAPWFRTWMSDSLSFSKKHHLCRAASRLSSFASFRIRKLWLLLPAACRSWWPLSSTAVTMEIKHEHRDQRMNMRDDNHKTGKVLLVRTPSRSRMSSWFRRWSHVWLSISLKVTHLPAAPHQLTVSLFLAFISFFFTHLYFLFLTLNTLTLAVWRNTLCSWLQAPLWGFLYSVGVH